MGIREVPGMTLSSATTSSRFHARTATPLVAARYSTGSWAHVHDDGLAQHVPKACVSSGAGVVQTPTKLSIRRCVTAKLYRDRAFRQYRGAIGASGLYDIERCERGGCGR